MRSWTARVSSIPFYDQFKMILGIILILHIFVLDHLIPNHTHMQQKWRTILMTLHCWESMLQVQTHWAILEPSAKLLVLLISLSVLCFRHFGSICTTLLLIGVFNSSSVGSVCTASVSVLFSSSVNSVLIAHDCGESMFQVQVHTQESLSYVWLINI